mmetsp:Transcript_84824/g.245091  ORF Transcript_84824/g.245091 Transcript_84824/m.245091 type:complete len:380 (+) Transcript_84824:52-1191(+)
MDLATRFLQEPFLIAAGMFTGTALLCWSGALLRQQPWLPLIMAAVACIFVRMAVLVERRGVLAFMPRSATLALRMPLFEILGYIINSAAIVACNLLRVAMLACMELDDHQKQELLTGMDPRFRRYVFQMPFGHTLPWRLRRLLYGRECGKPASEVKAKGKIPESSMPSETKLTPRRRTATCSPDTPSSSSMPHLQRRPTAESLLDLVNTIESVAHASEAANHVSALEKFLQKKVMSSTMFAARSLASSAQAQVLESLDYGCSKVTELGEGVRDALSSPRNQITAASAAGGAVMVGTGAGAAGMVSGGLLGAACGLVPAVFTFGLSIPIGAVIGGGLGLVSGATLGGTAGLVGGGAIGYHAYGVDDAHIAVTDSTSETSG